VDEPLRPWRRCGAPRASGSYTLQGVNARGGLVGYPFPDPSGGTVTRCYRWTVH
jgi:hypothetical protein